MPAQRGHFNQEIGRSKGGLTTKTHAVVDGLGNPLRIHFTAGNVNGIVPTCGLIEGLLANKLFADRVYDFNELFALAEHQNYTVVIPPMPGSCFNESMALMFTRSAITLRVSLPRLNHSAELLLAMIDSP